LTRGNRRRGEGLFNNYNINGGRNNYTNDTGKQQTQKRRGRELANQFTSTTNREKEKEKGKRKRIT